MSDKPPFTTAHADRVVRFAKAQHAKLSREALECGARPPKPPVLRLHPHDAKALVDMAAPTKASGWQGDGLDCYSGLKIITDERAPRLGTVK